MAKFCDNCGQELKDGAKFCIGCGAVVKGEQAQPEQPAGVQPPLAPQPGPGQQPQQQYAPPPGYQAPGGQPPPKKKSKKPWIFAGVAAAVVLVIVLAVNLGGGKNKDIIDDENDQDPFNIVIDLEKPEGRDLPFEPVSTGFDTYDPSIGMIEINQALSYGFDADTGEYYLMDSFVAGKETAIFVSLAEPPDPGSEIMLRIEKDGEPLITLFPQEMVDETTVLFQPMNMAEVNNWQQGGYSFTFELDDKYAVRTANFFEAMPLKILAVPVVANYSGRVVSCYGQWRNTSQMLIDAYPIAKDGLEYVLGPELDLSARMFDLNTDEGRYYVWDALRNLQTPNNDYTLIVGFVPEEGYMESRGFWFGGYTCGLPANIVCENQRDVLSIVLHEIAHCYKVGDEYPGGHLNDNLNPPPYMMKGFDIITQEPAVGTKEHVHGGDEFGLMSPGSYIYPEQRPYVARERTLLEDTTSFMSSATGENPYTKWITSDIWNRLFKAFTGQQTEWDPLPPSVGDDDDGNDIEYWGQCYLCYGDVYSPTIYVPCRNCQVYTSVIGEVFDCGRCGTTIHVYDEYTIDDYYLECSSCHELLWYNDFVSFNTGDGGLGQEQAAQAAASPVMAPVIEVTGYFDVDGSFVADPWYTYEARPSEITANKGGEYSVCVFDAGGELLSAAYFDVVSTTEITTLEGIWFEQDTWIPIDIVARFPDGAAKVSVLKGEQELFSRDVSENAPEVAFTGLSDYDDVPNITTLTWEASDADGDELYFDIYYRPTENEYYSVATNVSGRSLDVDLTDFPGSTMGLFDIYVSDGVNTGYNVSPWVKVPYKAPEILTEQEEPQIVKVTEELYFEVDIYDAQDGWLMYEEVEWVIDGDTYYDTGDFVWMWPYMISPGRHTFTCTATNSAGLSATRDFVFEIIDDESDLPDDGSGPMIATALRCGFAVSLNRIDAPVTRSEFAKLMFIMYGFYMTEQLPDDFLDGIEIRDCGDDDLYPLMMVALGVMEAPDGLFEPQKSLTEREAMRIMYRVIEFAEAPDLPEEELYTEEEYMQRFEELGMFSDEFPDSYQPEEKLTKKMALVRLGKFFKDFYPEQMYLY